jgi:hypothetical protein
MYLTEIRSPFKNTTYRCILLRETYRAGGKVKNRTLANLSHCTPGEIEAIRLALAHKSDLTVLGSLPEAVEVREGLSIGAAGWCTRWRGGWGLNERWARSGLARWRCGR